MISIACVIGPYGSISGVSAAQDAEREQEVHGRGEEVRHSPGVRAEPLGFE